MKLIFKTSGRYSEFELSILFVKRHHTFLSRTWTDKLTCNKLSCIVFVEMYESGDLKRKHSVLLLKMCVATTMKKRLLLTACDA